MEADGGPSEVSETVLDTVLCNAQCQSQHTYILQAAAEEEAGEMQHETSAVQIGNHACGAVQQVSGLVIFRCVSLSCSDDLFDAQVQLVDAHVGSEGAAAASCDSPRAVAAASCDNPQAAAPHATQQWSRAGSDGDCDDGGVQMTGDSSGDDDVLLLEPNGSLPLDASAHNAACDETDAIKVGDVVHMDKGLFAGQMATVVKCLPDGNCTVAVGVTSGGTINASQMDFPKVPTSFCRVGVPVQQQRRRRLPEDSRSRESTGGPSATASGGSSSASARTPVRNAPQRHKTSTPQRAQPVGGVGFEQADILQVRKRGKRNFAQLRWEDGSVSWEPSSVQPSSLQACCGSV